MKYKASEVIKRALDLADIQNTDFLSYRENAHYINDAWKQLYQWLINKGDKQFVKEVRLAGGSGFGFLEYEIPEDLYQIQSIKSVSGYIVPRKTDSESINSGTYDVVNNKLRLYGCSSDLILTYYTVPVWITYPDKTISAEVPEGKIVARYGNNVLILVNKEYSDNSIQYTFIIKNLITNEVAGNISFTASSSYGDFSNEYVILGPNVVAFYSRNHSYAFDWNGRPIADGPGETSNLYQLRSNTSAVYHQSGNNNPSIYIVEGRIPNYDSAENRGVLESLNRTSFKPKVYSEENISNYTTPLIWKSPFTGEYYLIISKSDKIIFSRLSDNETVYSYTPEYYIFTSAVPTQNVDWVYGCLDGEVTDHGIHFRAYDDSSMKSGHDLILVPNDSTDNFKVDIYLDNPLPSSITTVNYGFYIDGLNQEVRSDILDTVFNFPNELYVSLLSLDIAYRFAMKMNSPSEGLKEMYTAMQHTYMDTLSQSASYTRINNIYRS